MTYLKSGKSTDRLSELPDSLIFRILSFLPMEDVVRTTLLSKSWKDLWTTIPFLNFSDNRIDFVQFRNFVKRALMLWKGSKILKFDIVLCYNGGSESSDIDLWLSFAIENEVEELYVNLIITHDVEMDDPVYWAPQHLYSCSSITKLSLLNCQLKIHGNVQWDQPKFLTIGSVSLSDDVINQILSGAPQLEVLILRLTAICENLNIHSTSLKMLRIEMYYDLEEDSTVLTIWAPNVVTLEILGILYSKCVLMNISSLTKATVGFGYFPKDDDGRFSGRKLLEDILGQVCHSNRRVEKVALSGWSIKVLEEMKKKDMLAPLSNANFLNICACKVDEMVALLEIFPKLTTLVLGNAWKHGHRDIFEIICDNREPFVTKFDAENSLGSETDFLRSSLLHLTTIEIGWSADDNSVFPLMEFLLKYACKLEKVVFRPRRISLKPESLLLAAQKLLRMPRSSPTAEVILCKE